VQHAEAACAARWLVRLWYLRLPLRAPASGSKGNWGLILVAAVGVSVLVAALRGGRLSRLAELEIRLAWLVLAAVALQYLVVYDLVGESGVLGVPLASVLMVVSHALAAWFLWANRRLPGMLLVALGMAGNLAVMAANGGWMPITPEALERLGHMSWVTGSGAAPRVWGGKTVMLPRAETHLWWLSDIVVLPAPFPLPTAFSVGDVLIAVGVFVLLQRSMLGSRDTATQAVRK